MAKAAQPVAVNDAPRGPTANFQVELITPKIAEQMLLANTSNRSLSWRLVAVYAADMEAGRWQLNGDVIRFSTDGQLLDGQHRLRAVVMSKTPVHMAVARDLPADVFMTIDAGRKRSAADVLGVGGVANSFIVAAAARTALLYASGRALNSSCSRPEVCRFVDDHPYVATASALAKRPAEQSRLQAGPLAAVLFLANERRHFDDDAASFLEGLAAGAGLSRGDPRLTLREWASSERIRNRGSLNSIAAFVATARAWTAHVRGERLLLIRVGQTPSTAAPEIVGFTPA